MRFAGWRMTTLTWNPGCECAQNQSVEWTCSTCPYCRSCSSLVSVLLSRLRRAEEQGVDHRVVRCLAIDPGTL